MLEYILVFDEAQIVFSHFGLHYGCELVLLFASSKGKDNEIFLDDNEFEGICLWILFGGGWGLPEKAATFLGLRLIMFYLVFCRQSK